MRAHFLEAQPNPVWQGGMLLDGSNIQNHPSRDLVTLRNPRSRYSFINYLFEENRLLEHFNLPMEFPLRKEYAQYIAWVSRQLTHLVDFDTRVADVELVAAGDEQVFAVTAANGTRYLGRALVLAPGRTPYVPAPFDQVATDRVVHLTQYGYRLDALDAPLRNVAVIGGSQSAVELTLDLHKRFPKARVVNYVRAPALRLKDTSPFSEEGYFPEFTDYYFKASRKSKQLLDAYMRPTNYSSADDDVLKELYILIYEQRLDKNERVFVKGNRQIRNAEPTEAGVLLDVEELHTGVREQDEVDLVVLATGFRDLGPGPAQEPYPALLSGLIDRFQFDEYGYLTVNEDYSLEPKGAATPGIFLNGLCESTHGIGDSGSFSLLSLRAAAIMRGLSKQVDNPVGTPNGIAPAGSYENEGDLVNGNGDRAQDPYGRARAAE